MTLAQAVAATNVDEIVRILSAKSPQWLPGGPSDPPNSIRVYSFDFKFGNSGSYSVNVVESGS